MLTGCAAPVPSDRSGSDLSASSDTPAPSPTVSSSHSEESDSSQAAPETDPDPVEHSSASQQASESSLGPQNQEQIIQELLSAMTLEEKVGQMFFVCCPETGGAELAASISWGAICCSAGISRTRQPSRCGMTSKAIRTPLASPC